MLKSANIEIFNHARLTIDMVENLFWWITTKNKDILYSTADSGKRRLHQDIIETDPDQSRSDK